MPTPPANYEVELYRDVDAFAARAMPLLMLSEAAHCLQLGLLEGMRTGEWSDPFLAVVARGGEALLVAIRTPPHNLLLSRTDDLAALDPLVSRLAGGPGGKLGPGGSGGPGAGLGPGGKLGPRPDAELGPGGPGGALGPGGVLAPGGALGPDGVLATGGLLGPSEVADAFATAWARATGERPALTSRQRIYRLEQVVPVSGVEGECRLATTADSPLLTEWMGSFLREALPGMQADPATTLDRWLNSPGRELHLWEVGGRPVSMAGAGGRTPNGIRIASVYTPPGCRGRGYASALVARLSQRQLDRGRRFCFLFTDLSNPTSNRIYQRLGYTPVSDSHEYSFGPVA